MPQNYTKMWDAFLGGEWLTSEGTVGKPLTETAISQDYLDQTKAFYSNVLGPAFDLEGFGTTDLAGAYAQFSNVDLERAEGIFRSEIGDPYGGGVGDPFSWEKVSRYNTEDPGGVGRLQDLLEDQLYDQGKFLGGQTGADYGVATSKEVEAYTTGITGEITASNSSAQITGSGTLFTTEFKVGDAFKITSASVEEVFTIEDIVDNFSMSLDSTYSGGDVTGSHTASIDSTLNKVYPVGSATVFTEPVTAAAKLILITWSSKKN